MDAHDYKILVTSQLKSLLPLEWETIRKNTDNKATAYWNGIAAAIKAVEELPVQ